MMTEMAHGAELAAQEREGWLSRVDPLTARSLKARLLSIAALLADSVGVPRLFAAPAAGLSVPFLWATARTLFGRREATLAAALFALSFLNVYIQVAANAEVFMLLPLTAGLWAFALGARSHSPWAFLAAGALTSLAIFTRQSALWALISYGPWPC